ncbi:MAG: TonB-dependent receptor [Edaphocola sp.]
MRVKFIFLLIVGNFSASVFAQQTKGIIVINEQTRKPEDFISVQSEDAQFQKYTDENGFVSLGKENLEHQKITVSGLHFDTETFEFDTLEKKNGIAYIYLLPKALNLDAVTITSTKNSEIFRTISHLDIHLRPIDNSQDVLRSVPGLFIGQHAGGGKAEQLFIRGFDIDHGTDVAVSVDGMPVNMPSHAHGQGYADLHFVIPELIENVNFNKGPYFADKGNFATAAFVDFKTKDYLENNFAKIEVGQFDTYRGVLGYDFLNHKKNGGNQSLYFAGEANFTNGYFDNPQNFNRLNGTLKYYGKISENNFLSATITGFHSKWNASGQIPDRAVESGLIGWFGAIDPNEGGETSRYNANIKLASYLKNGGKLTNQFFYSKYDFNLFSDFTFFLNDTVNGDQIQQKENRNIYGVNSVYEKSSKIGNVETETNAGIQFRYDDVQDIQLNHTKNRTELLERLKYGNVNEANFGAFWSQKFRFENGISITPGLRYDYFNNQYDDFLENKYYKSESQILSPKLNINYNLNRNVELYTYFGKGFHSNDTRVAVLENGKKVLPPALGSDLGGIFKIGKKFLLQTAVWYLWLDQEFVYVGDEAVVEESGKTERYGLDVSARYEIVNHLFADFNLSWAHPKSLGVPKEESYIPLAPKLVSTGGITYKKEEGFNGSLRYRLMGDRPANEDNSVVAKGYFICDAVLNYTTKKWEIGASVQNIFNTKWKETQFDTESRLYNEANSVSEIHFTPGTPFFGKLSFTYFF